MKSKSFHPFGQVIPDRNGWEDFFFYTVKHLNNEVVNSISNTTAFNVQDVLAKPTFSNIKEIEKP
ncbi:hypothetical protein [Alteribacillus bidgolensis]|uniref:hypothetical protein n=1 Tax=Alteribacillus bidgolensis TaxID=930129 RepID=UPI001113B325|nr:hypothetical protein [Alteribacillus bidgolensis]